MKKYLVVDFGGTFTKYSVMTETGDVLSCGEDPSPLHSREVFLDYLTGLYNSTAVTCEISGVAISMPGVIDDSGYVRTAGAFLALYDMDLAGELKDRIPVPVTAENDGKCAALAEVWQGNLSGCNDGIVVILGTGVAGGIIKDRRIHKGKSLSAGEFSFILMDGEHPGMESSAMWKCAVSILMMDAAVALGIDVKKQANYALLKEFVDYSGCKPGPRDADPLFADGIDGKLFFRLLEEGDPVIAELYDRYTRNLARFCWNMKALYAPERILFGGGITRQPRLIRDINEKYSELAGHFAGLMSFEGDIACCRYGSEANQFGALYHHLTAGK